MCLRHRLPKADQPDVVLDASAGPQVEDDSLCPICQQRLRGAGVRTLPLEAALCGHVYHQHCIQEFWSFGNARGSCPLKCPMPGAAESTASSSSHAALVHEEALVEDDLGSEHAQDEDVIVEGLVRDVNMEPEGPPMVL